jgi:hypothetical protein
MSLHDLSATRQVTDEIRRHRDEPRFPKLAVPNVQHAGVEIDVGLCQSQDFTRA